MTGDETMALIQKSKASLDAARMLMEKGYFDFAASRAYYVMFYAAEALLADIGQSYSKHAAVIAAFGREFAKPGKLDHSSIGGSLMPKTFEIPATMQ